MTIRSILAFSLCVFSFSPAAFAIPWAGIFIAGDNSIENFDNGREDLTSAFSSRGELSTIQLSSMSKYIGVEGVIAANAQNITSAFENLGRAEGEGCLIHMTSHGAKGQGFYLVLAGILTPDTLADLVNKACGDAPTIIMVSACYSGQFITEEMKGPNRVILTAARSDRPSFGCSADTEYTYWDECVLSSIPQSDKWTDLYANARRCVEGKEADLGALPSEPQAFFGANTADWKLLH